MIWISLSEQPLQTISVAESAESRDVLKEAAAVQNDRRQVFCLGIVCRHFCGNCL